MGKKVDRTDIQRKMKAADAHYQHEKLGLGGQGAHEGWIKSEEAWAAKSTISAEARKRMIEEAAYYLAEKRGFAGNSADEDWMEAEAEIDAMLLNTTGKKHS